MVYDVPSRRICYKIADIVKEDPIIVPPDRECWTGIVTGIVRGHYESYTWIGDWEDLVTIYWIQSGIVEHLPGSVLQLIQRAN